MAAITVEQALRLAFSFHRAAQLVEAEAMCRQILAVQPDRPDVLHLLGVIVGEAGRNEDALELIAKALLRSTEPAICYSDLGVAYRRLGRLNEASDCFRQALAMRPDLPATQNNLGETLWELGDLENAMACCRRAIALDQSHVRAHANLGLLLLSTGDFEHGWRENEWRLALPKGKSQCSRPLPSGASAAGQTILLRAEQGFGDTIQFLRYLPLVRERLQARSVILECPSALARLVLQSDSWDAEIVVAQNGAPYPLASFDHDIPLFSLPVAMERFEPLAMTKPYLWAASELRNRWASRLDRTSTWRVGVAWAGSPNHNRDRQRSIKLEKWRPILSAAGVTFYSLQLGQDATQAQEFRGSGPIDLTGHITDFADTAALLAELDLVVCVDTSIAHLAGAMSKPVWTLLPFVPDWRWGLEREDTPWYPTMRLFRQPKAGDWDSVIQRVAAELRVFCSQPRLGPSFATS